jgi:sugar transferase (PEP-CTERM/EpsH1 system associated)
MKILMINNDIPYPVTAGVHLRIYNLLRRIAAEHKVWFVTFMERPDGEEGVARLREICQGVEVVPRQQLSALARPIDLARYLLAGKPIDLRLNHSEALVEKIQQVTSQVDFDVVQIEHPEMMLYLEALPARLQRKTVLMAHDIDFSKYQRLYKIESRFARKVRLWLRSQMLRRWEPRYAARFRYYLTVSETDCRLLLAANPQIQCRVVPNGVDTKQYQCLPPHTGKPSLLFVGSMGYAPNVDAILYFHDEIYPAIQRAVPDVELWIVGTNPALAVKQLASPSIHVTGQVEDVQPYYTRSSVCVVPLRAGGGTRLKIVEAMAFGRPVVSTTIGCEGLDVTSGENILIADQPAGFAAQVVRLLTDRILRDQLTQQARYLVETVYDWDVISQQLLTIYREVAE